MAEEAQVSSPILAKDSNRAGEIWPVEPDQLKLTNRLWSRREVGIASLFGREDGMAFITGVPFPYNGRTAHLRANFDLDRVSLAVVGRQLEEVDPRTLLSSQSSVLYAGVRHYFDSDYRITGTLYADHFKASNRFPVIYEAPDQFGDVERTILSGHHRSTAALLSGEPLRCIAIRHTYLR